ncbi:H/ACA ribonucleoprotein complex subunit 1, putative [Plasmodium berghei]|uniref:H/ACA ribonucleoprotein complex subunit n=2 Tax=Plasmodium berghei TaxID=5821 RepID=A0A509AR10_PLABA|nr:H/ACA ribonucleoprotein complex subunit 1, putative [Plasmodium berghei ANKA]CXJ11928.1 H/ACA ribonucleoprotein complex subunit 1, putative [Plasmodium berghei]SCM26046.1 H/ACA ribonucleoprotein complex subunit 1, putative [Plasmodium berghei]SCN28250.1 H/ACA ribonucleoprotein complex subunit 1, putative [Plasmodium berghei]SCO62448.1 H/ACA ribonucleoprotein complex subunit 1, putative [Plasmodium berghei]SCO64006.1 H/ACA ribonucleoprotein complex subunit 1, putative [Plasmodium berghei]|eukprot:XP_034423902.1 H/ACA ribonucleoprotein complex subunit 1, putative [Plasmodium berghei ANKA]
MGQFKHHKKNNFKKNYDNDFKMGKIILGGTYFKSCENDLVIKNSLENLVPYFNGRIFLENKEEIGKVEEVLGPINEFYFSVKLKEGILAKSFSSDTKFYIDESQTLPLSRFLPQDKSAEKKNPKKKKTNRDKKKNSNNNVNKNFNKQNKFGSGGKNRNDRNNWNNSGGNNFGGGNRNKGNSNFKNRSNSGRKFGNQRGRF